MRMSLLDMFLILNQYTFLIELGLNPNEMMDQ